MLDRLAIENRNAIILTMRYAIGGADAGDFPNGRLAWDVLRLVAGHPENAATEIDLSKCLHLKTYSLACLAAIGASANGQIVLKWPEREECRNHCARLGLHDWFAADDVPAVESRPTNVAIRQIQQSGPGDFSNLAVSMWLEEMGQQLSANTQRDLENHLDELILNALGHSGSPVGCFLAGQGFPGAGTVEVAIVDLGVTIRGHLTRNPTYAAIGTDQEAIWAAFREGVTGTRAGSVNLLGEPNSGVGLTNLFEFCRADQCAISVVSGSSCVCYVRGGQMVVQPMFQRFPGTLVNVKFYAT